jgi:signal transduction histidine kinase
VLRRPQLAATGITVLATLLRAGLTPFLDHNLPFITYYASVVLVSYLFGLRPALYQIGVSVVLARTFFMEPQHPFLFPTPSEMGLTSLFAIFLACVSMFMESLRQARREVESNARLAAERLSALEQVMLERRRERFWAESVLASIGDGVIVTDTSGRVTYVNEVAAQLTGWNQAEAKDQPVDRVFYTIEQSPYPFLAANDGRMIPVEHNISTIKGATEQELGKVVVFRDITENRRTQEALEASEKRLHASLKAAGSAAWEWNIGTLEVFCSQEFLDLTGARAHGDHVDFEAWMQSIHQDDRRRIESDLINAAHRQAECRIEHRAFRNGEVRWLTILGDVAGSGRMTGIVIDISDRRRIEEKLRNAGKQESLAVLSGGIAHDFNNLLTAILGYASMLRADVPPDSQASEYARNIELAGERAAHLTRQILAYSGQGRFSVERIDLAAHIRHCVEDIGAGLGPDIHLRLLLEPALPPIKADPRQVQQVVTNLVVNSIEAIGQESGCIHINARTHSVEANDFLEDEVPAGQYVMFEVQDNGPGMDELTKAKIFDPFFTTKFVGRGLGLAAVMGIVHGHGGAIHLNSRLGEGTTFQIFWPVAD